MEPGAPAVLPEPMPSPLQPAVSESQSKGRVSRRVVAVEVFIDSPASEYFLMLGSTWQVAQRGAGSVNGCAVANRQGRGPRVAFLATDWLARGVWRAPSSMGTLPSS